MPDLARIFCSRCGESVYNCEIAGADGELRRIPIVTRVNQGQPDDTGPLVNLADPNVRITSFTRELMQTKVARLELCEKCFGEVFGLPFVTPSEDPMFHSARANSMVQAAIDKVFDDPAVDKTQGFQRMHARALHAIAVAWDEASPEDLPLDLQPTDDPVSEGNGLTLRIQDMTDEQLAKYGLTRIQPSEISASSATTDDAPVAGPSRPGR